MREFTEYIEALMWALPVPGALGHMTAFTSSLKKEEVEDLSGSVGITVLIPLVLIGGFLLLKKIGEY